MKTIVDAPNDARAVYVLAHGAGAGMRHAFMQAIAEGLAGRGVAVLRYEFPYMEQGSKRPDAPKVAQARVREAVVEARKRFPGLALFAGGKSFGGRMTSQAQAAEPLPGVLGLAFLGFPLHAAGKPSNERAAHLADVKVPMLFLQGTRDALADLALLRPVIVDVMGDHINFVDSGEAVAEQVALALEDQGLLRSSDRPRTEEFYVTDSAARFRKVAELFLGRPLESIESVELGNI